uniref:Calx-beta domain-containing protein n=1 Tax=Meloidogyne enterolobii TaxID=390850 RepID=A0A6V7U5M9_MELEN|nr:unnamed protein product [Meloidogyne enterolobii]
MDPALRAFEEHRREFIETMRELRRKNPHMEPEELQKQAEYEMISKGPKSRAFYRTCWWGDIVRKRLAREHDKALDIVIEAQERQARHNTCRIFFDPAHYTVLENVGTFDVVVGRDGGPEGLTVMVDYYTEDGTANAGSDYKPAKGTLTFYPEDRHCKIPIEIVDDDVFEEDEHFYLHLTNLRVRTRDGLILDPTRLGGVPLALLEMPTTATIMILDDDHAGVFSFEYDHFQVVENCGHITLRVQRTSGCRGQVLLPYKTYDGSATTGKHYEAKESGEILFEDNQTEAFIDIGIVDTEQYERSDFFYLELSPPVWTKKMSDENLMNLTPDQLEIAELGKPRLGEFRKCQITIKESKEFQGVVDRMLKTANASFMLGTSSWREQFIDALTVSAGDDDDEEEEGGDEDEGKTTKLVIREPGEADGLKGEELSITKGKGKQPSKSDYLMHFISVPWKLAFATIPPTDYWGGWACFTVSILMIGLLTAVIGDLASQFGCWAGLKDAVTAISFVALGTSVPDTFASKVSAVQDKYADNSIGNVTGSNAVNVFLGIGIAWTLAAVYHWFKGSVFRVDPGALAFSVTIFCIEAFVCVIVIVARRHPAIGGELGGPRKFQILTSGFFACLWLFYIGISALESYCAKKNIFKSEDE